MTSLTVKELSKRKQVKQLLIPSDILVLPRLYGKPIVVAEVKK